MTRGLDKCRVLQVEEYEYDGFRANGGLAWFSMLGGSLVAIVGRLFSRSGLHELPMSLKTGSFHAGWNQYLSDH